MAGWSWRNTQLWQGLDPAGRLALMGLMEADKGKDEAAYVQSATNTVHANVNRANKLGWDTDRVLNYKAPGKSYGWFQPLDEPTQYARAQRLLGSPEYKQLYQVAQGRLSGEAPDSVQGATHYRAHDNVMLALSQREPNKYRYSSWASWSPPGSALYKDQSHSFFAPEGRPPQTASVAPAADPQIAAAVRASAPTAASSPRGEGDQAPQNGRPDFLAALSGALRSMAGRQAPVIDDTPMQIAPAQQNKIMAAGPDQPQFFMFGAPA